MSPSEEHGLAALQNSDLQVYSVGISTGGAAEIRMARANPRRHIIATTIDESGIDHTRRIIEQAGLTNQIQTKLEDVSHPLPYSSGHFDFIYARLVLHYLSKQQLPPTLTELRRILKSSGRLYVVVRSTECTDFRARSAKTDPRTGLTEYRRTTPKGVMRTHRRFFHTPDSIHSYLEQAGFKVEHEESYDETLYKDYERTVVSTNRDNIVELMARKGL